MYQSVDLEKLHGEKSTDIQLTFDIECSFPCAFSHFIGSSEQVISGIFRLNVEDNERNKSVLIVDLEALWWYDWAPIHKPTELGWWVWLNLYNNPAHENEMYIKIKHILMNLYIRFRSPNSIFCTASNAWPNMNLYTSHFILLGSGPFPLSNCDREIFLWCFASLDVNSYKGTNRAQLFATSQSQS